VASGAPGDRKAAALIEAEETAADAASGSKPEHETKIADAPVADVILRAIGLEHLVAFEKSCINYRFTAKGRDMLATVVTVPEIQGTFIELETMADETDLGCALADVRAVLGELGITETDLTTDTYTDAVMRARS
jgi:adenylate cyclase, class 2